MDRIAPEVPQKIWMLLEDGHLYFCPRWEESYEKTCRAASDHAACRCDLPRLLRLIVHGFPHAQNLDRSSILVSPGARNARCGMRLSLRFEPSAAAFRGLPRR
jgi:hypothetical protein